MTAAVPRAGVDFARRGGACEDTATHVPDPVGAMSSHATSTTLPLADVLWQPQGQAARAVRAVTLVLAGTLLLAVSAKVQIPFVPIPFTMQTAVVLAIGLTYGPSLGTATVAAYLAEGAAGLPVFSAGGGAAYLSTSPTAGFLWGMLAATILMGMLVRRGFDRTMPRALVAMFAGTAVIFAFGLAWLTRQIGWGPAVANGLEPFVLSELLKIAMVAVALPAARRAVERTRP